MNRDFYDQVVFLQKFQHKGQLPATISAKAVNHMPIHMHDGEELLCVVEGIIKIKISFNYYELKAGDFLLINTYEVHQIEKVSESNLILFLECHESVFGEEEHFFAFDPYFYNTYYTNQVERVKKMMAELYLMVENSNFHERNRMILNEIASICLDYFQLHHFDIIHKMISPLQGNRAKLERIGNTFRYLYKEFDHKIQLEQVAGREFIDRYYASHLIKSGTGSTFQEVLNIVRIDRAEVLILGTTIPINEIASFVGFSSYQYFNKQFQLYYHMTSFAYRKKYQKAVYPYTAMCFEPLPMAEENLKNLLAEKLQIKLEPLKIKTFQNEDKDEIIRLLQEGNFLNDSQHKVKRIIFELD